MCSILNLRNLLKDTLCTRHCLCCCDKMTNKSHLRREGSVLVKFGGAGHHNREVMAAGAGYNVSAVRQQREKCCCPVPVLIFIRFRTPCNGSALPAFRVDLCPSLTSVYTRPHRYILISLSEESNSHQIGNQD